MNETCNALSEPRMIILNNNLASYVKDFEECNLRLRQAIERLGGIDVSTPSCCGKPDKQEGELGNYSELLDRFVDNVSRYRELLTNIDKLI